MYSLCSSETAGGMSFCLTNSDSVVCIASDFDSDSDFDSGMVTEGSDRLFGFLRGFLEAKREGFLREPLGSKLEVQFAMEKIRTKQKRSLSIYSGLI